MDVKTGGAVLAPEVAVLYWLLARQSPRQFRRLVRCSSPVVLKALGLNGWRDLGVSDEVMAGLEDWARGRDRQLAGRVEAACEWLTGPSIMIGDEDPLYPSLLREIGDAPPLLFLSGNASWLGRPQVAMVGSRRPTRSGEDNARFFAAELVRQGLAVTSGLAAGIDTCAHEGALTAGSATIAVLGCGADKPYPRNNTGLADRIVAQGGLLVSEFSPGTPPLASHFPRRNRIISGLSLGVLVVEAATDSGSMITAHEAARQGRDVWAIPGSIHNPVARGCHQLIREGAKLVETVEHVLEEVGALMQYSLQASPPAASGGEAQHPLLGLMGFDIRSLDWLVEASGRSAPELMGELLTLELDGVIASVPGGYQRLTMMA